MRVNTSPGPAPAVPPKAPPAAGAGGAVGAGGSGSAADVSALQKKRLGLNQELQKANASSASPAIKAQQTQWLEDQIKGIDAQIADAQGQQEKAVLGSAADAAFAAAKSSASRSGGGHGKKGGGSGGAGHGHVDTYA